MFKIRTLFTVILVTYLTKFGDANDEKHQILDFTNFEQMKINLFILNRAAVMDYNDLTRSDEDCMIELNKIGNGLKKMELWAIKLIDAWGKFPSGLLDGNFYEFGGFSECFHIQRGTELYQTKYCTGQLVLHLNGIPSPKFNNILPNAWQMSDNSNSRPLAAPFFVPQPQNGTAITFGLCVPSVCSLEFLEKRLHIGAERFEIKLLENSCQLEEQATELKTIDWVTIGLLVTVLFLMLSSTAYDILFTTSNREKSQALLAFSAYSNGMKLLAYKQANSAGMMHCLHGIRVISTQWVVLTHSYFMYIILPIRNKTMLLTFTTKYYNMIILSAAISVDTFFILSGLLVSINILKHLEKTKGRINVPMLYFHRYLRLTPLLAVSILFAMSLLRFLGNGPIWASTIDFLGKQCERHWWSTLTFVQNYVNPKDICFGHSWYLSADTQLFVISPLIVYLLYRFKTKTLIALVLLILGCIACTLSVYQKYKFTGLLGTKNEKTYYPTHMRYSSWLIGIISGYILFKCQNRTIRIPKLFNLLAWGLSIGVMIAVIVVNYPLVQLDSTATPLHYGLYDALSRVFWAIALCYIIFACVHNSGGPVNWFLSHQLWQPISRICYAIYLLHFPVLLVTVASMKTAPYFNEFIAFHTFLGCYVITVFISIIASLAFESPIVAIEKILFSPKKK